MFKFSKSKLNQRRNSELPPVPAKIKIIISESDESDEFISPASNSPRRHSLPTCINDNSVIQQLAQKALYTINEVNQILFGWGVFYHLFRTFCFF